MTEKELKNNIDLCNQEIKKSLTTYNCGINTTYDCSHLILKSKESIEVKRAITSNDLIKSADWDDEDFTGERLVTFEKCYAEVRLILEKYNCMFESSYDYSVVVLIDKFENRKEI